MKIPRKITALWAICLCMVAPINPAWAGEKRIAIIETMDVPIVTKSTGVFIKSVKKSPSLSQQTLHFAVHNAKGKASTAAHILDDLISRSPKPDLLVSVATLATHSLVKKASAHNIPMLFIVLTDPVSANIVGAIGETSPLNITGQVHVMSARTKLDIMRQVFAGKASPSDPFRIALLASDYPSAEISCAEILSVAQDFPEFQFMRLKFPYIPGQVGSTQARERVINALSKVADKVDGYWVPPGPTASDMGLYDTIQQRLSIPQVFSEDVETVKRGALIGVLADSNLIGRSAATLAGRILSGYRANSIPVNRIDEFLIAVNVSTAIKLGVVVPSDILGLAGDNVYR